MMATDKYSNMIFAMDSKFGRLFAEFQQLTAELDIVSSPFTTDFQIEPDTVQLELIDLQRDSTFKMRNSNLKV